MTPAFRFDVILVTRTAVQYGEVVDELNVTGIELNLKAELLGQLLHSGYRFLFHRAQAYTRFFLRCPDEPRRKSTRELAVEVSIYGFTIDRRRAFGLLAAPIHVVVFVQQADMMRIAGQQLVVDRHRARNPALAAAFRSSPTHQADYVA